MGNTYIVNHASWAMMVSQASISNTFLYFFFEWSPKLTCWGPWPFGWPCGCLSFLMITGLEWYGLREFQGSQARARRNARKVFARLLERPMPGPEFRKDFSSKALWNICLKVFERHLSFLQASRRLEQSVSCIWKNKTFRRPFKEKPYRRDYPSRL